MTYEIHDEEETLEQCPSPDEEKAKSVLSSLAEWISSGKAENSFAAQEARTGVPKAELLSGFCHKAINFIGKAIGFVVNIVGSVVNTLLDLLFTILKGGANLILNAGRAVSNMFQTT